MIVLTSTPRPDRTPARLLRRMPKLLQRVGQAPEKRTFLRMLGNTYYSNYINLSLVFRQRWSDRRIRRVARQAVEVYVKNGIEYLTPGQWRGFTIHGQQHLDAALNCGKGLVVACQHLGPQRFSLLTLAQHVPAVHAAVTEVFVERLRDWLARVETDANDGPAAELAQRVHTLAVEEPTCALKMVRALRRGEAVMFDVDGNIGVGGEGRTREAAMPLTFLGREVQVRTGVAYLSHRTGAPILPVLTVWGPDGQPHLEFQPPMSAETEESRDAYCRRVMPRIYGLLEATLLQQPEQWEMWPQLFKWIRPPAPLTGEEAQETLGRLSGELHQQLQQAPQTWLQVHPHDAFTLRIRDRRLLIDRRNFRFFLSNETGERLVRFLHKGIPLQGLLQRMGKASSPETTLHELARLHMLDLLEARVA